MNAWKERLIEYIKSLDDAASLEEVEKLILTEVAQIKQEESAKVQEPQIRHAITCLR